MIHKLASNLLAYVLLPALVMLLLEGCARWLSPEGVRLQGIPRTLAERQAGALGYVNRAGFVGVVWEQEVHINAHHLRSKPLRDDDRPRVLLLGDSVLFGVGLRDAETAAYVLESYWQDSVQVLNGGVIGYSSMQQAAFLHALGPALRPDAVVVLYFLNDPYPSILPWFEERSVRRSRLFWAVYDGLLARSMLFCWMAAEIHRWQYRRGFNNVHQAWLMSLYRGDRWQPAARALVEIVTWCRRRNIPVAIAVVPSSLQLLSGVETSDTPQRLVARLARQHAVAFLDLRPYLTEEDYLYGDWGHLNATGMRHALLAMADAFGPGLFR